MNRNQGKNAKLVVKNRSTFLLFCACILFLSVHPVFGAGNQNYTEFRKQFKFKHYTVDQGLSNNLVHSISEDKNGYIWMGTRFGLNRFNGIEIKNYYSNINDSSTLPSDFINIVFCDSQGTVWIGTDNGISIYKEGTDNFERFSNSSLPPDLKNVYDIVEDEKNQLWFATGKGLLKFNTSTNELQFYTTENSDLPSNYIYRLLIRNEKQLWLSCYDQGLSIFNIDTGNIKTFKNKTGDTKSLSGNMIERMYKDSNGNIWIGTYSKGLNKWNEADSTFSRYIVDRNNVYSVRIRSIFEDNTGQLFLGSRGGLYLYDNKNDNFRLYASSAHEFSQLSGNSVMCNYIDSKSGLWLGTYYGGVNYANLESKPFISYTSKENNPYFLNGSSVFGMTEDKNGNLYLGTGNGVNILDLNTSLFKTISQDKNKQNTLSYNDVKSIVCDSQDDLWIATNNGGLNYYSQKTGRFKHYKNIPGDSSSIPYNKVYFVFLDSEENIWVLTNPDLDNQPGKLSLFDKKNETFKTFKEDFHLGIVEDKHKNLLIGGFYGFWKLNILTHEISFVENKSIIGKHVWSLHLDEKEHVWIGSDNGVAKYDPVKNQFKDFFPKKENQANNVYGILSDEEGSLWISTSSGLIKMVGAVYSSDSISYKIYDKDDGLPSKQFIYNSSFKNRDGEMFFGGNNGFVRFHPNQIKDNSFAPAIILSELIIDGNSIKMGDLVDDKPILQKPLNEVEKIELNHKNKSLVLKFDALHFINPVKNRFKYQLENFEDDWHFANSYNNSVTYSNLSAGTYIFKIFAITNEGIYSEKPKVLEIKILPPFWETMIFRISAVILILLLGYFLILLRIKKYKRQEKVLQNAVNKRTTELNISNKELKEQQQNGLRKNEEIKLQNEKLLDQTKEIERSNELYEIANKNLQYLNDAGKQLSSKLKVSEIQDIVEKSIKTLVPVDNIGFGLLNKETEEIVFSNFVSDGKLVPEFSSSISDSKSLAADCFNNKKVIVCNDFEKEYSNYISEIKSSSIPQSVYYQPLLFENKSVGVLTMQSYKKEVFTPQTVAILDSLIVNILIALNNAFTYEIVNKQKEEIDKHNKNLEQIVEQRTKHLEQARLKAEESDRLKSSFLANMSHEIRTPLNAIVGFIDLLGEPGIPREQAQNFYSIIKNSSFSLLQLISDIIDISKIEAGQLDIFYEDVNLTHFLNEIKLQFDGVLKQESKNTEIRLELVSPVENQVIINVASRSILQVFNNLLGNAIKFTSQGEIKFGIKEIVPGKEIIFFVKDTGIGIDKKNHSYIFERFRKIEDDTSKLYRGTGLGLAITKHLVEKLGGRISLHSELNKGSEFTFSVPIKDLPELNIISQEERLALNDFPDWSDKVFLIAEDEITNFLVLKSIFASTNVKILHAADGMDAVTTFLNESNRIDLVLMDIKMPRKNGMQALKEIRIINPDIKVIAQTAYAYANEKSDILDAGFNDYISKPIIKNDLIRIILKHL